MKRSNAAALASTTPVTRQNVWLACLCALAVGAVATSNQSLWIDEGGTAYKAIQPTLSLWWDALWWERNTNLQLPLYLLYVWAWEKLFGASEFALRAANIPLLVVCVLGLRYVFAAHRERFVWSVAFLLTSPFVWFYANEARPYLLLLAASFFMVGAVYRLIGQERRSDDDAAGAVSTFAISSVVVAATSMLAVVWMAFAGLAALYCCRQHLGFVLRRSVIAIAAATAALLLLGAYYAWVLKAGIGVTRFGHGLPYVAVFGAYELMSFAGLGPSRLALRQGIGSLQPYFLPLTVMGFCWIGLLVYWFRSPREAAVPRRVLPWILLLAPAVVLFAIGWMQHVRVLPRYLTPAFPALAFFAASALMRAWNGGTPGKALAVAFLGLSLVSAAQLRFAPRHEKENYRLAAATAQAAVNEGRRVFWGADEQTAIYYKLIPEAERGSGTAAILIDKARLSDCDCVVLSRVDVYDRSGIIRQFIADQVLIETAQVHGFQIYCRSPERSPVATASNVNPGSFAIRSARE